ncbi:T9SS type A sorting domain-containing protein [Paracnuella aquatica]|uniref:T9SS type A sorting domain-containing protein n=1 Tax=Paracnuella aquatica TaxID=2268757 RepID=UPI000DEEF382|nr:T9SS type A sorting domain-containing protein [Paracnuella aquatica]RPD45154.1 T9SS C-terminal target domain-containing protein [Paracnuella aquatica]
MKKSLRSFLTVLAVFTAMLATAQGNGNGNGNNGNGNGNGNNGNNKPATACGVSGVSVEVVGTPTSTGNTCTAEVNLYFTAVIDRKNVRFVTAHIYNRNAYPTVVYNENGTAPTKQQLGNVLATVVLERDPGQAPQKGWKISSVYSDKTVPVVTKDLQLIYAETPNNAGGLENFFGDYFYFNVRGLKLTVAGACSGLSSDQFVADIWSGGVKNEKVLCASKNVSLANCDATTLPIITGFINCQVTPRAYTITLNNTGNCRPFFVDYKVYRDVNNNQVKDAADKQVNEFDNDGDGLYDNVGILVPGQGAVTTKLRPVADLKGSFLFVEATLYSPLANGAVDIITVQGFPLEGCEEATLPVKFKTFNVQRDNQKKQQINLSWETAMEQNNAGFQIQRKVGNNWETIAYIPSKAPNGNSNSAIRYQYADNNTFQAVSQYRLQQEDLDGALAYSDVKSVRGIGHVGTLLIYPNPSESGQINLLFSEPGTREVLVSDLSGRIVKQYREVSSTLLTIDGLAGGFYTVKIIDRKTGAVTVEKVVVKKR